MQGRPGGEMKHVRHSLRRSELFPMLGKGNQLLGKGHLLPVVLTLAFALLLLTTNDPDAYRIELGVYLCAAGCFVIYRLCGKRKPAWYLLAVAVAACLLLISPLWTVISDFFHFLAGGVPRQGDPAWQDISFPARMFKYFVGVGMAEEFTKALPVFLALWIGLRVRPELRDKLGVFEPLDGIVLAAASATGFVFVETVFEYAERAAALGGNVYGLEVLIPRILSDVTGHLAYSGYFGYFIGLAMMRPSHKWKVLGIGFVCSAALHGFWDSFAVFNSIGILLVIGALSYAGLAAAILKARQISPTRAQNFATNVPASRASAASAAASQPAPSIKPPQGPAMQAQPLSIRVGNRAIALSDGCRLGKDIFPGLQSQAADGIVAEVCRNPNEMSAMRLRNLSRTAWTARIPGQQVYEVAASRSIRLDRGMRIDFGAVEGEVQ